jgi:hypothetical protein
MDTASQEHSAGSPAASGATSKADSFFGWDQLILLATPFPVEVISRLGYVLGLDSNAADKIVAPYWLALLVLTFATFGGVLILTLVVLLFLIGRNLYLRRPKRLVLYGVVLIGLPVALRTIDTDYLRFRLQQQKFEALVAQQPDAMPERSAPCFVFDYVQDNFYIGGANFDPFNKLILFVSEDLATETNPRIDNFASESKCPKPGSLRDVRKLKGRFYIAIGSDY